MSKKEKLLRRFLSKPTDFTFDELVTLLNFFGFELSNSGKTTGSACKFENKDGLCVFLHKPHPKSILKSYQVKEVANFLKEMKLI